MIRSGVWRGTVTRVSGSGTWVNVPRIDATAEFGPLEALSSTGTLVSGDRVLLAQVEGRPDDLVIIGRLP